MLENRKKKYQLIKNKIELEYTKKITELDRLLKVIENMDVSKDDNFETIIFKKYVEFESVNEVANCINDLGYKVKTNSNIGCRKYISKDISNILTKENIEVEAELKETVSTMFLYNSYRAYKRYCQ
ncbi:hypothetical protein [Clostridium tagluense]|uniref:hypothetical protein n=1 Tax=Clostridium tagluense TaxID=360422 RepID=UPI001C6F4436|nr:hypothetical protein [Clostridium tagluense]MBW9159471.1 hypothetical protein [Clostridium tagluense]WLC68479.1 hypothetical protein KTC93_25535 [Clostridium tagluense]